MAFDETHARQLLNSEGAHNRLLIEIADKLGSEQVLLMTDDETSLLLSQGGKARKVAVHRTIDLRTKR